MLRKLVEISDHKGFRVFKWGALPEMGKLNLFYGWNGSGKTTLSNLLAQLEKRAVVSTGKVTFQIDKHQVAGDKLSDAGGCKNFCVNGQLAGNCCTSKELHLNDRHKRIDRQPAG